MCNQDEIAMNAAGRASSHRFQDLRSASLARKREIAKQKKYYHFRGLSPSDLHTPHYLPVCASPSCPTQGTPDDCWLSVFPANLSTAPLRAFTKREFYEEAQRWPRPPTYHHTYQKDKGKDPKRGETCKWDKMQYEKKQLRREMRSKGWRNEVDSFEERPCDCGCDFWHWFYLEILREELKFEGHDTEPEGLEVGLSGENMAGRSAEVGATPGLGYCFVCFVYVLDRIRSNKVEVVAREETLSARNRIPRATPYYRCPREFRLAEALSARASLAIRSTQIQEKTHLTSMKSISSHSSLQ